MEITFKKNQVPIKTFKDLEAGNVFIFSEEEKERVYMKTDENSFLELSNGVLWDNEGMSEKLVTIFQAEMVVYE